MNRKQPFCVRKGAYALSRAADGTAEMELYGDICESRPVNRDGNPVAGQFILLDEFLEDMKQIEGCSALHIRISSYGGDAGVSCVIHNRLRELSRAGVALRCTVDGVAMSGGSIIMCACDSVTANPGSLIMIHKAWSFLFGGYNADELRELAVQSDAWDRMQVEAYKRKTGLDDAALLAMMAETTYMTGREAKEKGFVDALTEGDDAPPIAAADGHSLFVRGRQMHLAPGMAAPDNIPTVKAPQGGAEIDQSNEPKGETKGANTVGASTNTIGTLDELRAAYPDLLTQAETAAVQRAGDAQTQAERDRLREIDAIAGLYDAETVNAAKYGEGACTAQEMAYHAAQAAAAQGAAWLQTRQGEAAASGAQNVGAAPPEGEPPHAKTDAEMLDEARSAAKAWNEQKKQKGAR